MLVGDLTAAAERLLDSARARGTDGRASATTLRGSLADLYELWLGHRAGQAGIGGGGSGVALLAVGSLGRREPVPYSDLDLVLVHRDVAGIDDLAHALWYPLWDAGIGLDHAVRTPKEVLDVAGRDLRTALGLLDARFLAGDADLAHEIIATARQQWQRGARSRVAELAEAVRARWHSAGEIGQLTEPDLKYSGGGLRDVGLLDALAAAQLTDRNSDEVRAARALLLDTRTQLRVELRRDRDVLDAATAASVASAWGMRDRFALARELSGAGRAVRYALEVGLRTGRRSTKRIRGLRAKRKPLADGVVLHDDEVALARGADPRADEGLLLRVGAAAARGGHPIGQGTLRLLADTAPEPRAPWSASVRAELIGLLGAGEGLYDVVEAFDRHGLWGRLFPEWGAVRDLQPREPVHTWTVDRHLLGTCVAATERSTTVARPDLLMLGALLHDIGKGRDRDHSELGAEIARSVADRIGLPDGDAALVSGMVRHHLLLPTTAMYRDISEPRTVKRVARAIGGDPLLLELLHALAYADGCATGPGTWTAWRAGLVAELASRCLQIIDGKRLARPEPLDTAQRELAEAAVSSGTAGVTVSVDGSVVTVTAAAARASDVLVPMTGVLALHSLEVHAATVRQHAGTPVGVFTAAPRFGTPPEATLLREQVTRALHGTLAVHERLAAKERDYACPRPRQVTPRVSWEEEDSPQRDVVLMELRAGDRIGLLYRVACALRECRAEVSWLRAVSHGTWSVDAFALRHLDGAPDHDWRQQVQHAVIAAAAD
ncbi:[protein-PII] uridylyltransferase [Haloechinothrix sp. LS1_15]|uniref:[protein-PII] uridylyltransferase n=1 Tax=Haloechinothrix sp. LS1_15 TaxID=2652248 RepID=UPI0029454ED9|nr:[protein-PII] uridylyltransferase [Haloechinothrix sp. LS1_15]MDV6012818.1 [protein-PII] uridylyltransferase [Haloechinothrix sp. LS1_15]